MKQLLAGGAWPSAGGSEAAVFDHASKSPATENLLATSRTYISQFSEKLARCTRKHSLDFVLTDCWMALFCIPDIMEAFLGDWASHVTTELNHTAASMVCE